MANSILEELLAVETGIGICWLGNLGWLIRAEGLLIAFDLGYVLTLEGRKLYQPGDTVLLQEQLEDLEDTGILFVSPTLHNTHIEASKTLIEAIQPDYIFPQHFGTYLSNEQNSYWTVGYPDELKAALPESLQKRFHKLDQGNVFHIA